MEKIYIRNHDSYAVVLEYMPGSGPVCQVERDKLPANIKTNGFYVEVNGVFVGVFASKDGPLFFYNKNEYLLSDPGYTSEVHKKTDEHIFVLKYKNEVCLSIRYLPVKYKNYDNWSDEITLDFFLWITDRLSSHREQFIKYRTL